MGKVARSFIPYGGCRKEAGFLLAELQISVAVLALVVALLYGDFYRMMQGWQRMFSDMQINDAARYMGSVLEKDLCYEGSYIILSEDYKGRSKLICQTGHAGKTYTYTWESKSFYKSTKTTGTSGKNPLFVPDVYVVDWQVAKIDERFLKMNFVLEKQGRRRSFERVYHCFNGVIAYE